MSKIIKTTPKAEVVVPLVDKVTDLLAIRAKVDELDAKFKKKMEPLKAKKEALQASIIEDMKHSGQFSARFKVGTASLSVRKTAQVIDNDAVVAALKSRGLEDYISEQPNDLFDGPLKEMAKGAEILPGIVIKETEYLSVRPSEKDEPRKVTAEPFKAIQ